MTALRLEQSFLFWDLMANERLVRMLQAESDLGTARAFTAAEMMDMLHTAIFTACPNPNVDQRTVQKDMTDALITAAAESEGVKINKNLYADMTELRDDAGFCSPSGLSELCSDAALTSRPRAIYMSSLQMNRTSDALSVKRGELMRIRAWAKARAGEGRTAVQMHCVDLVQRIDTALGL